MDESIRLGDKTFVPYLQADVINDAVVRVADQINFDLSGQKPLFLVVLNGAFIFAADLLRNIRLECEISCVKFSSYHGTTSTGVVNELIGLKEDIAGRTVVIIEDIVDSGNTIVKIVDLLKSKHAGDIRIATLLYKPQAYNKNQHIHYRGLEIPNDFIVGYGLDYDGLGRNLKDIFVIKSEE
ncbi:MAG: hypoxanthine phosphoribosyltransferase [Bacteroidia bacterium]